jgi:NitT/TauT family transport system substrate-binding protein
MPITRRTHLATLAATGAVTLSAPMVSRALAADKLSIAVIPIADCAPIYLGKQKGFFAKQNLDITLSTQGGGAAIIPGVLSGQLQFGFSNVPSLLIAQNKGLKFVGVAPGVSSTGVSGHDFCATLVPGDSPIKSAKDLVGKTVAVNNLNNIGEVAVRAGVKAAGGDPKNLKYIEVPFPDMPAALANHRIEAGWMVEPFVTIAQSRGDKVVDWPFVAIAPKAMIAVYFASVQYVNANPGIVKRFKAAIAESLAYADSHADEVRQMIPTYTRISSEIAAKIILPIWPPEFNQASAQAMADDALQNGLINKKADLAALLP